MPGTIKIGNEGFRSTIKTDSSNKLSRLIKNVFSKPIDLPTLLSLLAEGPVHNALETEQCEFVTQCHSANRG